MTTTDFTTKTHDGVHIEGWSAFPNAKRGTLVFCHGYMSSCRWPELKTRYLPLCERFDLRFVAFDFRSHGQSGKGPLGQIPVVNMPASTFGKAESWDLAAVLNALGLRDVMLVGDSLGGMAAQLTAMTDARVRAVWCYHTPGWAMHAVGTRVKNRAAAEAARALFASSYGFDILGAGDIRQFPPTPSHRPLVLHMMGTKDSYGIDTTRVIYDYWYRDVPGADGKTDLTSTTARKWFFPIEGAEHTDQSKGANCVWHHPEHDARFDAFIRRYQQELA